MKRFIRTFIVAIMIVAASHSVAAENTKPKPKKPVAKKFIAPPKNIERLAVELGHSDFPQPVDILAIARVESAYKTAAYNKEESKMNPKRKLPPSRGVMQVQGGSFDIRTNMTDGSARLREYYFMFKKSKQAAVMSYNIGPTTYKRGKARLSAVEYWSKYQKRRKELVAYYKKMGDASPVTVK